MIQFDEHIVQMGWFNHQLEILRFIYHDLQGFYIYLGVVFSPDFWCWTFQAKELEEKSKVDESSLMSWWIGDVGVMAWPKFLKAMTWRFGPKNNQKKPEKICISMGKTLLFFSDVFFFLTAGFQPNWCKHFAGFIDTPWKIKGWNLKTTCLKTGKSSFHQTSMTLCSSR